MSTGTPLVGVTTYYAEAAWGSLHRLASIVPATYFELVAAAGGRPVFLPPLRSAPGGPGSGATEAIGMLSALVLIGGGDVEPESYGAAAHAKVGGVNPLRDQSERALLAAALDVDLPVLAICRGQQLLNVQLGGSIHQHLPDVVGHSEHQIGSGMFGDMDVVTVPGTVVSEIFGDKATVRCSHHQSIDRLGEGLIVSAYSVEPTQSQVGGHGVIEAVEAPGRRFVVGVQWHPEESGDVRPFAALVRATR